MSTFFEYVCKGTLGFEIQKLRIWILPQSGFNGFEILFLVLTKGTENPFLDSKSGFGF